MARGATNQKGPERAFLNAIESIIKTTGKLPVNILVAAEGEEELGSTNYPEIIEKYEARLRKADGAFFPLNAQDGTGAVSLPLGVKGILSIELEAIGGPQGGPTRAEIHSSLKAVVDAPAWRLAQALAALTTPDGNTIQVPGYYDAIRSRAWRSSGSSTGMSSDRPRVRPPCAGAGRRAIIDGLSGRDLTARYLFYYDDEHQRHVERLQRRRDENDPAARRACAARFAAGAEPDARCAARADRKHLAAKGFSDIKVRKISGYSPAQTSVEPRSSRR